MQERYIFREMLSEIKELADQKGNVLTLDEVKEFFKNAHLTDEQLNMVCVYLIGEKIRVEGYEGPEKQEQTPEKEEAGAMEESDCLELYQAELEEIKGLSEEEELKCFQLASAGDPAAKSRLTEHYLKTVYDLSKTFAFGSVPRSDLIQEGNVALVLALEELEFSGKLEDYQNFLYEKIREAMEDALSEGQDLKDMGDKVAQKVNHLSEVVHNLEEDLEHKVSVDELSAYLDMPVEEIRDILRMAGDEIDVNE